MGERMKVEHIQSYGWESAIRGARNPLESWSKSSSSYESGIPKLCENDYKLAMKLVKAGRDHRKFVRQIFISCDVSAPWYWWKEYATYKIGTVENSTSQMHKLGSRLLDEGDFVFDVLDAELPDVAANFRVEAQEAAEETRAVFEAVNKKIKRWRKVKEKDTAAAKYFWRDMIQCIPASFIYKRTCTLNYEVLANMYSSRKNHKLAEWRDFLSSMINNLPYPEFFTIESSMEREI